MFMPRVGYRRLAANAPRAWWWVAIRRPLLHAVVLGTSLAMAATRRVDLALIVSVTLSWSFVVLLQWAAAWMLVRSSGGRNVPFVYAVDLCFVANAPWLMCYVLFAAWASFPAPHVRGGPTVYLPVAAWIWTAVLVVAFCRHVLDDDRRAAWRRMAVQQLALLAIAFVLFAQAVQLWPRIIAWVAR
jgi:hypothetical protein